MPGLVPGIHVLTTAAFKKDVDGRDKPGHDGAMCFHQNMNRYSAQLSFAMPALVTGIHVSGCRNQRIGGAYWMPPAFQSWLRPRGIPSGDSLPRLRSNTSS